MAVSLDWTPHPITALIVRRQEAHDAALYDKTAEEAQGGAKLIAIENNGTCRGD